MIRLAAALALLCGPAWGQEVRHSGGDVIELRASAAHFAEVFYSNSGTQNSKNAQFLMRFGDLDVVVTILVQARGDLERVTVEPVNPAFVAVPAEADVKDGESVVIQIMQPLF